MPVQAKLSVSHGGSASSLRPHQRGILERFLITPAQVTLTTHRNTHCPVLIMPHTSVQPIEGNTDKCASLRKERVINLLAERSV